MAGTPASAHPSDRWYLSIDCATKSFAWALLRVRDGEALRPALTALAAADTPDAIRAAFAVADLESKALLHLAAGGAADLVPGKKDAAIPTVERVRAVVAYLRGTVTPAIAAAAGCPPPGSPGLHVAIEYQMGANSRARTVATVVAAEYAAATVFFVGPALKNRIRFARRPDLDHGRFIEKYGTQYTANKSHAKAVYFGYLAGLFGHRDPGVPARMQTDFSDCIVQVLGFLRQGDSVERAAARF